MIVIGVCWTMFHQMCRETDAQCPCCDACYYSSNFHSSSYLDLSQLSTIWARWMLNVSNQWTYVFYKLCISSYFDCDDIFMCIKYRYDESDGRPLDEWTSKEHPYRTNIKMMLFVYFERWMYLLAVLFDFIFMWKGSIVLSYRRWNKNWLYFVPFDKKIWTEEEVCSRLTCNLMKNMWDCILLTRLLKIVR